MAVPKTNVIVWLMDDDGLKHWFMAEGLVDTEDNVVAVVVDASMAPVLCEGMCDDGEQEDHNQSATTRSEDSIDVQREPVKKQVRKRRSRQSLE